MRNSTPVPNSVFDIHLPKLSDSQLKIYLIIIRQTLGWKYKNKRKERDRITHAQFVKKTGLSRRVISKTIQTLINYHLILVTDYHYNKLLSPQSRKGKSYLYYQLIHKPMQLTTSTCEGNEHERVQRMNNNKRKLSKETITKGNFVENSFEKGLSYLELRCKE